jgi:hypothetical protein
MTFHIYYGNAINTWGLFTLTKKEKLPKVPVKHNGIMRLGDVELLSYKPGYDRLATKNEDKNDTTE